MPWPKGKSRTLTKAHREKISKALIGRQKSPEHRKHISDSLRGKKNPKASRTKKKLFAEGKLTVWNKGKTKETDPRVAKYAESVSQIRKKLFKEGKLPKPFKGHNWGLCKKCGKFHPHPGGMKGKKHSEETRRKMALSHLGKKNSMYGRKHSERTRKLISEKIRKKIKEDKGYREKLQEAGIKGFIKAQRKPSSHERRLISVIWKFNLPYKYTGDGSFLIGRLCPDFISTDGAKKVIEIFSHPWHTTLAKKSQVQSVREYIFRKEGYEMMILWAHEMEQLTDKEIALNIKRFHKKEGG